MSDEEKLERVGPIKFDTYNEYLEYCKKKGYR